MNPDPIVVALLMAAAFERLGSPYLIGGSVASTLYGEPRTTMDVDFATRIDPADSERVVALCSELEAEFFVRPDAVAEAVARRAHCNVVHRKTMMKVDLYVRPDEGLYAEEMARAELVQLRAEPPGFARVATPEDTLLQKLRWYELGERVSDRQWRDVVGILKQQRARLDRAYLARWAHELNLSALLEKAFAELGES